MKINQYILKPGEGFQPLKTTEGFDQSNALVLAFGDRFLLEEPNTLDQLNGLFPDADIVIGSTSGEIVDTNVYEGTMTVTAMEFERSFYRVNRVNIEDYKNDSEAAGHALVQGIEQEGIHHILIISDGGLVNGSSLLKGMQSALNTEIAISGGLCGDGARFEKTLTGYNDTPRPGEIIAVALGGEDLTVGYASFGGWDPFGPNRLVTRSVGNKLYELDGQPAIGLYKKYLGEKANELPGAALLFPLSIEIPDSDKSLVRTILTIDEEEGSMTFAGDIPEGATARLMKANFDRLIDGASEAAKLCIVNNTNIRAELAILISCVGRKLVLDQRIEEEVEEVSHIIGEQATITGFYSYGELAPFAGMLSCELHNQTMTLTILDETS